MGNEARELLAAKLKDGLSLSQKRPYFLGFLDESEAAFCEDLLRRESEARSLFWGGFQEAERKMLGFFPEWMEPAPESFPIAALTFHFRQEDSLSHRDFLGSFMALGVERDVLGEILVEKGRCVAFVRQEMESYFRQNIRKIGRVGVRVTLGAEEPLPLLREFLELSGVVASDRLDCLVAFLCRTGREKASQLITGGMVLLDHRECLSVSERVKEGEVLSVRKYGKFIIDRLGPQTSKGRLAVQCRKYK